MAETKTTKATTTTKVAKNNKKKIRVVLVKSPKMLSGLLRLLFGIKKENNT